MRRTGAMLWHASFSVIAAVLYFFFVVPRWFELTGQLPSTLGTVLRIVTGLVIGLAALPVVFTLLRTRAPEFGTPQLALNLRVASIVLHVLAGVLIVGTAVTEIWVSLDDAGRWLFGSYGAAAAIALLGIFAFYLAFVAELPPPPPKPVKPVQRTGSQRGKAAAPATADTAEKPAAEQADATAEADGAQAPDEDDAADAGAKLRNRRPSGKTRTRRRSRGSVAVEE